ncbi:MAG: response regulator transcription factor [Lachnospiraceae bacterium]|nr:response regulator transcription factor [Lachnospiraceae bacterium]
MYGGCGSMFVLSFCDDDCSKIESYEQEILSYFSMRKIDVEIVYYQSGDEILKENENGDMPSIDLLFLDVEMPGMDGIEVKNILSQSPNVKRIIFLSNYQKYMKEAFGLKVVKFMEKPVTCEEICKEIEKIVNELEDNKLISYSNGKNNDCFYLHDLRYIDVEREYTQLHFTDDSIVMTHHNLPYWLSLLKDYPIMQIHRGYLVNLYHVKRIEGKNICLDNGLKISIGRRFFDETRRRVNEFHMKLMMNRIG